MNILHDSICYDLHKEDFEPNLLFNDYKLLAVSDYAGTPFDSQDSNL